MSTVELKEFEHSYMEFVEGGLDEKLYYDRYSTPEHDIDKMNIGDIVICKLDRVSDKRIVGILVDKNNLEKIIVDTRTLHNEGLHIERKEFHHEFITKPLDLKPHQFWTRWAKAGASVEKMEKQLEVENEFRWLMDGFQFSTGGRIQLMAGQEYVNYSGEKANLTAFNCFSGDTIVQTKDGAKFIKDLKGEIEVLSQDGVYRKAFFKDYGVQELFEIELSNGEKIKATAGHEWVVNKPKGGTEKVTTLNLEGRMIPVVTNKEKERNYYEVFQGIQHGIFFADGSVTLDRKKNPYGTIMLFGEKKAYTKYFSEYTITPHYNNEYIGVYGVNPLLKELPKENCTEDYWYGFLVGLIGTDGCVDDRGSVMFHSSNLEQMKYIIENLHKTSFGYSSLKVSREINPYNDEHSPCYKLQIIKSTVEVGDLIKESHIEKFKDSPKARNGSVKVVKVVPLNISETVYCCNEPETHTFVVGTGYLSGNCFVIPSPKYEVKDWDKAVTEKAYAKWAMQCVIDNAINEAQIMSRGGGVGYNASPIPPKIMGAGTTKEDIILYLPETHKDSDILQDLKALGKFDDVTIITTKEEYIKYSQMEDVLEHRVQDSREGLLNGTKLMVDVVYDGGKILLDFSDIRHKGALVKGVNGRSSGSPSWMTLYNTIANLLHRDFFDAVDTMNIQSDIVKLIEQGGSRRGRDVA